MDCRSIQEFQIDWAWIINWYNQEKKSLGLLKFSIIMKIG